LSSVRKLPWSQRSATGAAGSASCSNVQSSAAPVTSFNLSTWTTNGRDGLDSWMTAFHQQENSRDDVRACVHPLPLGRLLRIPTGIKVVHLISFVELSWTSMYVVSLFLALRSHVQVFSNLRVHITHSTLHGCDELVDTFPRARLLVRPSEY